MKRLLSVALLTGSILASTGCVDEFAYSRRPHSGPGFHDTRRTTTHYETRPVYRNDRRIYRDDRTQGHRDVQEYDKPQRPHSDVRIIF